MWVGGDPIPSRRVRPVYGYGRWVYRSAWATLGLVVIMSLGLAWIVMTGDVARAAELTGSQVITLERSDDGELYAALSIVLEAALAPQWSAVVVYDQAAEWPGDRWSAWDVGLAWRPAPGWSVSVGRRWRVGPPPDYGGPWTYVQVWRGM